MLSMNQVANTSESDRNSENLNPILIYFLVLYIFLRVEKLSFIFT